MATKRKALGTGLEQLFNNQNMNFQDIEREIVEGATKKEIREISVDEIRSNPYQPRKYFNEEALAELSESIKEHGIIQPIIVKKSIKGYEIVAGERRHKAAKLAGLTKIPAIVKEFTDREMMEVAILENTQREDLNAIEEAEAYNAMLKTSNITQEVLAKRLSKSRSYITNIVGLVRLPEEVKELVITGKLSSAHARILSKLENDELTISLAHKIIDEGMSVRTLEAIVRGEEFTKKNKIVRVKPSNNYSIYENLLREKIGTRVIISSKKVTIPFKDDEELGRILEAINVNVEGE